MRLLLHTLAAVAVAAALWPAAAPAQTQDILVDDGAWCWFQDPRAVFHDGDHRRTYFGYVTAAGDITVSSYDHDSGGVVKSIVSPAFQVDDHASPALDVRPDGRVAVYWSAHGGGKMFRRVTTNPEDISGWSTPTEIGTNAPGYRSYTYPNVARLSGEGGRTYLFWRAGTGGTTAGQPVFTTSDDGGTTWAPGRLLLENPGQRPYVKYDTDGDRTIRFAFTEAHPNSYVTSVYYAEYRDGAFYRAERDADRRHRLATAAPLRGRQGLRLGRDRLRILDLGHRTGFPGPAGDRLRDVPDQGRSPLPLRALDRHQVGGPRDRGGRPRVP